MHRMALPSDSNHKLPRVVRVYAPGGIGNLGPGLDILGCAVTGAGDTVEVRFGDAPGVIVETSGHADLPTDATAHASAIASVDVLRRAHSNAGIVMRVEKGLPLAGGQGGSAASAVAGAVATNMLLGAPLDAADVLYAALAAESKLAGRHIDNVAPALFGGILLIRSVDPLAFDRLPVPSSLRIVLVHPGTRLRTADSRAVLPPMVDRATALAQAAAVGAMVEAFCLGDLARLRGAVEDRIAEPARAPLLPGFVEAKRAALDAGALGCSISGGGPSSFALTDGDDSAGRVLSAMLDAYRRVDAAATGRIARVDTEGARLLNG
jgi:homoserine kinase